MNSYDLAGRNAIITGGAGGFGCAIAERLLAAGAAVSLWDVAADRLETSARQLAAGSPVTWRQVDITDGDGVRNAVEAERAAFGRLDILVNNAGILGEMKPIWETDPAIARKVIEVNLMGAYLCMRAVVPVMRAQEARPHRGHIVNVASIQGKEGMPLSAAYSASKAGLIGLTKSVGKELAQEAIYVNCITPAAADTAMAKLITPERKADILRRIPMGRMVEVDEVARMVAWLVSTDCSFSTGAVFDLSGGRATY
jgi:NAD(P)-dependent dehydrogenase (short-subunit alcohol dehydrogenase family)